MVPMGPLCPSVQPETVQSSAPLGIPKHESCRSSNGRQRVPGPPSPPGPPRSLTFILVLEKIVFRACAPVLKKQHK